MTTETAWRRVTRAQPCQVCGRPDWCGVSADGALARCMRAESVRPCRADAGGWLHRLTDAPADRAPVPRPLPMLTRRSDLDRLAREWVADLTDGRLCTLADSLGVAADALRILGAGWTGRAFSFPMTDASRRVVGIRLRCPRTGRKWAVRGGREGVFLPLAAPSDGPLMMPEGPTDSAALLGLGLDVVGRPSCTGGVRFCAALARHRHCVVLADSDAPGRRGAEALATALAVVAASVRVVEPPAKDAREWVRAGATRDDVLDAVEAAPYRRLHLRESRR